MVNLSNQEYISATAAAKILRVTLDCVLRRLRRSNGVIQTVKLGRVRYLHRSALNSVYLNP